MTQHATSLTPPQASDGGAELLAWTRQMQEQRPVLRDDRNVWHVLRYDDVQHVMSAHTEFANGANVVTEVARQFGEELVKLSRKDLLRVDPPEHQKLRKLISRVFTPRAIAELAPSIEAIGAQLLDEVVGEREFDLVEMVTQPLPVLVIANLIGVPPSDLPLYRSWAERMLTGATMDVRQLLSDAAAKQSLATTLTEMNDYMLEHCRRRRSKPEDDLISRLVQAEVDGDRLDDEEVVDFARFLLKAGHITTTMLLGNSMLCFREYPDALAEVRADHSLIPTAVEEVMRYRPPTFLATRYSRTDVELSGVTIPAQSIVSAWMLSANRDPRVFARPDVFDIHRTPNPHLSLGKGIHFCIGAPLARLEGKLGLKLLFDRYLDVQIAPDAELEFYPNNFFGVKRMPVHVTAK